MGLLVAHVVPKSSGSSMAIRSTTRHTMPVLKGVGLSPQQYTSSNFLAMLGNVHDDGSVVIWSGNWNDLANNGSTPYALSRLAGQYGYKPIIVIGAGNLQPQDETSFVTTARNYARMYQPSYLGLGNEVNKLYANSPTAYATFKRWFSAAAVAVKQVSPSTSVFTTFQYEQLNGMNGGLSGRIDNPAASEWGLLKDFPDADLLAFTTYPYMVYQTPATIPANYYSRIRKHTSKPVAFTAIAWPSSEEAPGYTSSPQEQADFVGRFASLTKGLHPRFVVWPFLYDQGTSVPFAYTGLINFNGAAKPAMSVWRNVTF